MTEQNESNTGGNHFWPTVVGAAFGLIVGTVCVFYGFAWGLFVLATTVLGALIGRYSATGS